VAEKNSGVLPGNRALADGKPEISPRRRRFTMLTVDGENWHVLATKGGVYCCKQKNNWQSATRTRRRRTVSPL